MTERSPGLGSPFYTMESPIPTDAQPPFDSSAKSDAILRSSDNVNFYVLKILLSLSSSVFENIFSLPQPVQPGEKTKIPTIQVAERGDTLQAFLPFFYPGNPPRVEDIYNIINVMAAGHKYGVDPVVKHMSQELLTSPLMTEDPLRMFAIAFHHGLEEVGRAAAKNTLAVSVSKLKSSPELAFISGTEAYQLSQYRLRCISAIRKRVVETNLYSRRDLKPFLEAPLWRPIVYAAGAYNLEPRYVGDGLHASAHREYQYNNTVSKECVITLSSEDVRVRPSEECIPFIANEDVLKWWFTYTRELLEELDVRPRGSTVLDDRLSTVAIKKALDCLVCRQRVHQDLANFKRIFAEDIEEVISQVPLDIDFGKPPGGEELVTVK